MATKISVATLMTHLAKAADIAVSDVACGALTTTQGPNKWLYAKGGFKYGGPVDCSGLIVAIARNAYDANYPRLLSEDFKNMSSGDLSAHPVLTRGVFLWKDGHVGIYTGQGKINPTDSDFHNYTIEAFDDQNNVGRRGNRFDANTAFTKWGYLDFVQY